MPRGADYYKPYCLACEPADACSFCFRQRVTTEHRLPLERAANALIATHVGLTPRELARLVAKYARSDAYARELNALVLGGVASEAELCDAHQRAHDLMAKERADAKRRVKAAEAALAEGRESSQREIAGLRAQLAELRRELEDEDASDEEREGELKQLRRENRKLQRLLDGKSAACVALEEELAKLREELARLKAELQALGGERDAGSARSSGCATRSPSCSG